MAPTISAPLPSSMQMCLRPNRAVAPGAPDMPKPKRSSSVVRAEKDESNKQKRMKEANQLTKVKNLAMLEDCMQEEERSVDLYTNNPPIAKLKKALSKTTSAKIGLTSGKENIPETASGADGKETSASVVTPSASTGKKSGQAKNPEKQDKGKERNERGKKTEFRELVIGNCQLQRVDSAYTKNNKAQSGTKTTGPAAQGNKRRNSEATHKGPDKKAKVSNVTEGLRTDWGLTQRNNTGAHTKLGKSHHKSAQRADSDVDEPLGGLSDNDGAVERATLNEGAKAQPLSYFGEKDKANKVQSLAAVIIKTEPAKTEGSRAVKTKKDDITVKDLLPGFQNGFRSFFVPILRQFTGTLGPWESPSSDNIWSLWCIAFPSYLSQIPDGLFLIISKLIDDRLANWRNGFSNAAMQALEKLFADVGLETKEQHAEFVRYMLGENETSAPFYYRELPEDKKPKARTISISTLRPENRTSMRPVGALVLSIQSVRRALFYFKDGTKNVPAGPSSFFSKTNWHEQRERREGHDVTVNSSCTLEKLIKKLNNEQWDMIIKNAQNYAKQRKADETPIEIEEIPSSDIELVDGDLSDSEVFETSWERSSEKEQSRHGSNNEDDNDKMYCSDSVKDFF